ncbi:ABC transporter substrate-binding protein [Streptacidiphilus sp. P02-A3a]|uniref:ABC transporter substrate-binding protein n=1 Tax=Streptacidiphilus sp. P02-A3a TaxID=2704468 RepID=UPI0015FB62DA|nr:extracellular solute-binding protein [Streptacidiphilus sp. P02-A3a]QMU70649.1 extracellular solute-binding protein [Streptacidiphilus sp. P02-A3a]
MSVSTHRRLAFGLTAVAAATALLAGCSGSGSTATGTAAQSAASGPVKLTYWAWAPNLDQVVALWNTSHPDIQVTVEKQASGDALMTKVITAAKAGGAPDLVQAEYQAIPTLVSNNVLADISRYDGSAASDFAPGVWKQVTLGTGAVYAIPQDTGPLMYFYRKDLFTKYGLTVPTTWAQFAADAAKLHQESPSTYLATFSSGDPGLFAGLAQQAGSSWWTSSGSTWKVGIDDAATQKVADFWGGLVKQGVIDNQPMYTPAWSKALNDGSEISWVSAVWAPGVLASSAPATAGKWAMVPLPQWSAGQDVTGSWGGSSTAVTNESKHQAAAAQFAQWLNTDPTAVAALVKDASIYPAATDAESGSALATAPAFLSDQPDFYTSAAKIAATTAPAAWGPNVNVAYSAFTDDFGKAAQNRSDFSAALSGMAQTTVSDLKTQGFTVSG